MTAGTTETSVSSTDSENRPTILAVIDIGATSVRMAICEVQNDGTTRMLETLSQSVSLGKDSFIKGKIEQHTIEDCVRVLKIYREKLDEYSIDPKNLRVVATSAVREASNRLAFNDRIYIATGFEIEPFDEAELHRVTYLGILPFLKAHPVLNIDQTVVIEVGGGSTEYLLLRDSDVAYSRTFRMGSLRLRKTLEAYDSSIVKTRVLMESQIEQMVQQILSTITTDVPIRQISIGGDMRLVVNEVCGKDPSREIVSISLADLEDFTNNILAKSPDQLVGRMHLSLPDAESLGPALLSNLMVARALKIDELLVVSSNLRDGLIEEMAFGRKWSDEVEDQVVRSAINIGRKYRFNERHALHVANLAVSLFDQLSAVHQVEQRFRSILFLAGVLHEVGQFISTRSYHKHSMFIVQNTEFFGIGARDQMLLSLVIRYHRRALPQPNHDGYASLNRSDRIVVVKLAAILRIARALDAGQSQRIASVDCQVRGNKVVLTVAHAADLSLEQMELRQANKMFRDIFGLNVVLNRATD